ncbi:MAG: hypothetical protein LW884_10935 [Bacteroidetes bacterium]|jgi:predicted metalloprotease with PDZ domain|nr:hypothetical protein [Bacteroidota bacterium]
MRLFIVSLFSLLFHASHLMANDYAYTLRWLPGNHHTYEVSLQTEATKGKYTDFKLPVWRPGRYFEQDFAASVTRFQAMDAAGNTLSWQKTDKSTWRVENPRKGDITIRYHFYANTQDAGSCYVDDKMVYFNGHNLLMYKDAAYLLPCTLTVPQWPEGWPVATALRHDVATKTFYAQDYHELVDSPTILSPSLKSFGFDYQGHTYHLHFQADKQLDEAFISPFRENVKKIVAEQVAIFGEVPFEGDYHFIYWLVPFRIHHAVEHSKSAMFCKPATVAETPQSLSELNGITSHEFWHVWNVKSIRPAALWPYDYSHPQYTSLHWFTEGVTEYMSNLILVRAGLLPQDNYLDLLTRTWAGLDNKPVYAEVSPSQSSWDSWLARSLYMPDHLRNSYYPLGDRVGFLLDMRLRKLTDQDKCLDDVFRYLYTTYYKQGKGVPEDGVEKACETLTGTSFASFFRTYVHSPAPVDYAAILKPMGLKLEESREEPSRQGADKIGLMGLQTIQEGYQYIAEVERGSPAFEAGVSDGELLLMVDGINALEYNWEPLEPGKKVELMLGNGTDKPRLVKVKYEKESLPIRYELKGVGQAEWKDRWLSSQAAH